MPKDRAIKIKGYEEEFSDVSRSQYSITDVLAKDEFLSLSKQLKIGSERQTKLCDSFYGKTWKDDKVQRFERSLETTVYERSYNEWKKDKEPRGDFESTYQSALALVSNQRRKKQVNRLIKDYSVEGALLKCSENNLPLQRIKDSYQKSFNKLIMETLQASNSKGDDGNFNSLPSHLEQLKKEKENEEAHRKQKLIQVQIQEVLLNKIRKINQKQMQAQAKNSALKQMEKTCFSDIIQHPPIKQKQKVYKKQRDNMNSNHNSVFTSQSFNNHLDFTSQQQLKKKQQKRKKQYRLKVEQILKIPHRLFLIFYSDNYHQIVRLSTPQELEKINRYRQQALLRQQSFEKLKQKVQNQDPETISRLPYHMKQKLFKVLYEENVEQQKYYQKN